MTARRQDITIEQGADYDRPFQVLGPDGSPVNLTGCAAAMQIRAAIGFPAAMLTLTSAGGTLQIDAANGLIRPLISEVQTATLLPGRYVYDVKMLDASGRTVFPFSGTVYVVAQVTTIPVPAPAPAPAPSPAPAPAPAPAPEPPADNLTDEQDRLILDEFGAPINIVPYPVPIITSGRLFSAPEGEPLTFALAADTTVTWDLIGPDAARFTLSGSIVSLPYQDFEAPTDVNGDNIYEVTVRATNSQGNSTSQNVRVTILNIVDDTTPAAFAFPDILTDQRSTAITSNTVTIADINLPIPVSISGGEYSKGGGAFTTSPDVVRNGDTLTVRVTSSADDTPVTATLMVGEVSTSFSVYDDIAPPVSSGLVLRLDATHGPSIIQSGGAVSEWRDRSGSGNHTTQGDPLRQPISGTRTIFNRNAIDFDGTDDFLLLPSALHTMTGGNNTVFIVALSDTGAGSGGAQSVIRANSSSYQLGINPGGNQAVGRHHSSTTITPAITKNALANIYAMCREGNELAVYFNTQGSVLASGAQNVTITGLALGAGSDGASRFNGLIAEVMIYNRAVTLAEANQIAAYLKNKWGVASFSGSYTSGFA